MSPITFKLFTPRGDCRRITYEGTPELATINELVDSMVEGRHSLSYRDSEGDIVLLKTSRDVVEAVRDANAHGSKSIRVQIRVVRECPRNNKSNAAPANSNKNADNSNNRNRHCHRQAEGPQWRRCGWSRGLFGQPYYHINSDLDRVADEVDEIFKHFAPFFGVHVKGTDETGTAEAKNEAAKPASGTEHPSNDESGEHSHAAQETAELAKETATAEPVAPARENGPAPAVATIGEAAEPQTASEVAGAGFTFVDNEPEDDETGEAAAPGPETKATVNSTNYGDSALESDVDEKLKLLKDMGFELPQDVARNMIKELNGRMDLIVRALVANQK